MKEATKRRSDEATKGTEEATKGTEEATKRRSDEGNRGQGTEGAWEVASAAVQVVTKACAATLRDTIGKPVTGQIEKKFQPMAEAIAEAVRQLAPELTCTFAPHHSNPKERVVFCWTIDGRLSDEATKGRGAA